MSKNNFDFIIVGAGSAGCVLANRLSANPDCKVLLIEAGGKDSHPFIHMPAGISKLVNIKSLNWNYYTQPETHLNNRRLYWPRGKVLGGSSSINAMCYCRGHKKDYDLWESLGNDGWSFADVLPYFIKSENNQRISNEFHGNSGPLHVSDLKYHNVLTDTFLTACQQQGYNLTDDFNAERQRGFGLYQVTQHNGSRSSASQAYLTPIKSRTNLTVWTKSYCQKVIIENNHAKGVEVIKSAKLEKVYANTEVILSGGALNSPHILMLSGVGAAQELQAHDIKVQHDLPGVGKNLQDHLDICLVQGCSQNVSYDRISEIKAGLQYYLFKSGPGTSNAAEAGGFLKTSSNDSNNEEWPNLQFHFVPAILDDHGRNRLKGNGYTLHMCYLRPQSRGKLQLASKNPMQPIKIFANYLSEPEDLAYMKKGFEIQRKIFSATAFDQYRSPEIFPGNEIQSEAEIETFIRNKAETIYHPVGTCKMGNDAMAVVDNHLRVHAINNLRVVDASIMPNLISGNTNAPTIMIAEKISDSILTQS
ncbi:Oxidoreductase, GMC family [hydrothermal vent metagenome]|uniref:Oxidoreductase, GMC family n=1 Tax=hydrothermal vent metagenome TaxID=652676 RepID=A0A3B0VMZ3_9ZZZZ